MSITVLNPERSEFDFSKLNIKCDYNVIIHCVYDPVNNFDEEYAFLHDPQYDSNTLILLWHPVELGWFHPDWMGKLDKIMETAPYRLIYLTGCSHKQNVNTIFPHEFEMQFLPIFDVRSTEIWQWGENEYAQPITIDKPHKFMFINSKDEPHRRYMLSKILKNNLLNEGVVSYRCQRVINTSHNFDEGVGFTEEKLAPIVEGIDSCIPHIPILIDDTDVANGIPREIFLGSYVGIIGETHIINVPYGMNMNFVSEKTFNAIANNQMFMIVGQAGSLDLLRSLGYKTFDGIIDESYDTILNNPDRLEAVTNEAIRFISRPIEDVRADYIKVLDIIEHNRDLLFKQNLQDRIQGFLDSL